MKNIDLRLGSWQKVLADVDMVDALILDPPYSKRTHGGKHIGQTDKYSESRNWVDDTYAPLDENKIKKFTSYWIDHCKGWFCVMTDSCLHACWEHYLHANGLYVFSPIAIITPGSRVRLAGDGPSQWAVWMVVARPRTKKFSTWGTLDGAYFSTYREWNKLPGAKPLNIMRRIVKDYSRPGDLVCDPFAGSGTTLIAAAMLGRRAIGAEKKKETWELAQKRLGKVQARPTKAGLFT